MPETSRECVVVLLDETSFSVPVKVCQHILYIHTLDYAPVWHMSLRQIVTVPYVAKEKKVRFIREHVHGLCWYL